MSDFEAAAALVKDTGRWAKQANNDQKLTLYGLFKQGTSGDVEGDRPGILSMEARAKYDAWAKNKGKSKEDAQREYIAYVEQLKGELGFKA